MRITLKGHCPVKNVRRVITAWVVFACTGLGTSVLATAGPALVEGVAFARQVQVDGRDLPLRGLGLLRYMVFIKAYVAALYLPETVRAEDALSEVPRHLEIEYFHAIAAGDFAKATTASIERNTSLVTFRRLEPTITSFNALYRDVNPGDRYALTYVPGTGTTLSWNGAPLGTVPGAEFAAGLFGIWLGPNPLDRDLKRLLLDD
jgi:hypothetical protein